MVPLRADWAALARKYRTLAELRRQQLEMDAAEARGPLRRVAQEFPGSLRELDALPLEVIEARAATFDAAVGGGPVEPWMVWMGAFHSAMRVALGVKRRLDGRRMLDEGEAARLVEEWSSPSFVVDVEFIRAVARPPGGRLSAVVMERLSARFGVAESELALALFPERRRPPG